MRSLLVLLVCFTMVLAHPLDDGSLEIQLSQSQARGSWTLHYPFLEKYDDDGDRVLSASEMEKHDAELRKLLSEGLTLSADGQSPRYQMISVPDRAPLPTHARIDFTATWEAPVEDLTLRYHLWPENTVLPRCLLVLEHDQSSTSAVLTPEHPEFSLTAPWPERVKSFVVLGLEHIFTGYDHILFLLCLLLPGGSFMTQVKTVTAFTLAHSLTLTLSVLNVVDLPSRLVESVIALSIVVAALLNLRKNDSTRRWPLALVFGLIHGLGFASILRERGVQGTDAVLPLVSFNVGVELGQLLIVLLAFPLIRALHRQSWGRRGEAALSILVALLAAVWFVERLYF